MITMFGKKKKLTKKIKKKKINKFFYIYIYKMIAITLILHELQYFGGVCIF